MMSTKNTKPSVTAAVTRQQSNAATRRKARELIEQGLTRRQIAKRLRHKECTVTSWLTGLGGETRRPWTDDETRAVLTMRAAGVRWCDISVALQRAVETTGKRKREPKRYESPLKPVTWAEWHEQRERERAAPQPQPHPIPVPVVDDWEDRPLGHLKTNSPAR